MSMTKEEFKEKMNGLGWDDEFINDIIKLYEGSIKKGSDIKLDYFFRENEFKSSGDKAFIFLNEEDGWVEVWN